MLALRKMSPGRRVSLEDVAEPAASPGEVIVEIGAAGICGSDLHVDHDSPSYGFVMQALPVTLGHELAGTIVALGQGVEERRLGERTVIRPSVSCGKCTACLAGDEDACRDRRGIGMTRDGGFARFVAAPAQNCLPIPENMPFEIAALTEPLTVARQAVSRGEVKSGDRVLVIGPGTIGQGIAILAGLAGAAETAICGRNDGPRLAVARSLGVSRAIDIAGLEAGATEEACGTDFDVVFEASGNPSAIDLALRGVRQGGVVMLVGLYGGKVEIDSDLVVRRQIDLRGSHRAPVGMWRPVLDLLSQRQELFGRMITHRFALSPALDGFEAARSRQASKVMIHPVDHWEN